MARQTDERRKKRLDAIRNKSVDELAKEELELRAQVWKQRLQLTTGQLQDPTKVRRTRKQLARVLTIIRERELQQQKGAARD
jgi:large subunit ribosomal protein L29